MVKTSEGAQIFRLSAPWRKQFDAFSIDHRNLFHIDQRSVISQTLVCPLRYIFRKELARSC